MDILGTIKAGLQVVSQWMSRQWGSQTSEQATLQNHIVYARACKRAAFEELVKARTPDEIQRALNHVNYWDDRLTRLSKEAAAKWP